MGMFAMNKISCLYTCYTSYLFLYIVYLYTLLYFILVFVYLGKRTRDVAMAMSKEVSSYFEVKYQIPVMYTW